MKAEVFALTTTSIVALARFVQLLGFNGRSAMDHIAHVVSDVLQGWGIAVARRSHAEWAKAADDFANALCTSPQPMSTRQSIKLSFLDGVRWSRGDFNTRHSAEKMRIMLRRAKAINLDNPAKILTDELDATKLNLMLYDKKQQRLLQSGSNRPNLLPRSNSGLLTPGGSDDAGPESQNEEIVYDESD